MISYIYLARPRCRSQIRFRIHAATVSSETTCKDVSDLTYCIMYTASLRWNLNALVITTVSIHSTPTMNLTLNKDDPLNTTLLLPDGRPLYHIETSRHLTGTNATRIRNAAQNYSDTGMVEWHTFHRNVIYVGPRVVEPHKEGTFST